MFTAWIHWLSSLHPDELWLVLGGLLLVDAPRYALSQIVMCLWDCARDCCTAVLPQATQPSSAPYSPTVCVVLAGYNEAQTIDATLRSLWNTYPNLQIIVVDDGSLDGMADGARRFAADHAGVLVLSRERRGGKSSALNSALPYTEAEVVVTVDTDSHLAPRALWEIVQPLQNPAVGAVSATVRARNPFTNLVTWLQTYEYLQTIFVGRLLTARLGLLGIVSGAFGAFRREALERVGGWDVGPGEDGDLTLRIRKVGYQIAFAPHAQYYSNVPTGWRQLFNQRCRWDRTIITFECRKHIDMAYFWQPHFRWLEFVLLAERWFFNIVCVYGLWDYTWPGCFGGCPIKPRISCFRSMSVMSAVNSSGRCPFCTTPMHSGATWPPAPSSRWCRCTRYSSRQPRSSPSPKRYFFANHFRTTLCPSMSATLPGIGSQTWPDSIDPGGVFAKKGLGINSI